MEERKCSDCSYRDRHWSGWKLVEKNGAAKLSEIDPAKYATLLAEAEVLGDG